MKTTKVGQQDCVEGFRCIFSPGLTWTLWIWHALTWSALDSPDLTWTHLDSLGLTWFPLDLLRLTRSPVLGGEREHIISQGKGERILWQKKRERQWARDILAAEPPGLPSVRTQACRHGTTHKTISQLHSFHQTPIHEGATCIYTYMYIYLQHMYVYAYVYVSVWM